MLTAESRALPNTRTVKGFGDVKLYGYSLLIALIPVLMMYKVPVVGMGLSTILVAVTMPYAALKAIPVNGTGGYKMVIPMMLYCGYVIIRSDGNMTNMLLSVAIMVHMLAASSGTVRFSYTRKVVEGLSVLAAGGVILQNVVYYLFHFHIPMIAGNWVLDEMVNYRMYISTGISAAESLYRPSAFFLEPSHLAQYAIVGLISCLFRPTPQYRAAAVISLGILLTTSGMGVVLTVFAWGAFILRLLRESNTKNNATRVLSVVVVAIVAAALLSQSGVMQSTLSRLTGRSVGSTAGYNAIWGRTLYWKVYITPMSGTALLWGKGFGALPDVYFTGLMEMLFCYGWVGVALFYGVLIPIIIKSAGFGRCVAIAIGALMLIANLSGFLSFIYFFGMLYAGRRQQKAAIPAAGAMSLSQESGT